MREVVVRSQDFRAWAESARQRWSDERYARALRDRTVFADEGESFAGWEWLMPIVRERGGSIFDYLKNAVVVIDEPSSVETHLSEVFQSLADRYSETDAVDDIAVEPSELYLSVEELRAKLDSKQRVELRVLAARGC